MIKNLWNKVSYIGVDEKSDHPDDKTAIVGNQVIFILTIALTVLSFIFLVLGIYRAVIIVTSIIGIFLVFSALVTQGKYKLSRIMVATAQNIAIFCQAVYMGAETGIIEFLVIAALMPIVLFSASDRKYLIFCISQNFILYLTFHLIQPYIVDWGLPVAQQQVIYYFTIPVKFLLILMVLYIVIKKRKVVDDTQLEMINELERVNSGLKQFAFVTSHDLKTPLRNISTYLQLLKRRNTLDTESNEMVDSAVRSVKHMNQLLTDIFLYATTDFKHEGTEAVDINTLMLDMRHDFKALLEERGAELIIPHNMPNVQVNAIQATHIFSNLIGNALKYNKADKPVITVSYTKLKMGFVEFTVADNGIGIEPKYQEQIFEIFKRLHTQEEFEGTGIGLAICKKIVESYGGTIRVSSEAGKGAQFSFTLPGS